MTGCELDVLAVGEAMVDLISVEQVESLAEAHAFEAHVGGQAANLAANVARLGGRSAVLGRVGDDGLGQTVRRGLAAAGVDTTLLAGHPEAPTTVSLVARTSGTPDFIVLRGADRLLDHGDLEQARPPARLVHTSAFALSREPARGAVLRMLEAAHAEGTRVSLDPNYHPSVWPPGEEHLDVLEQAFRTVDVTKPSLDDCERLFGRAEPEEHLERFLAWGARLVVLTLGRDGALVGRPDAPGRSVPAEAVDVVDVTGAGDAFWAGFLLALGDGLDDEAAVRVGHRVAAIKLQRVGQLPDHVDRTAIYRELAAV